MDDFTEPPSDPVDPVALALPTSESRHHPDQSFPQLATKLSHVVVHNAIIIVLQKCLAELDKLLSLASLL